MGYRALSVLIPVRPGYLGLNVRSTVSLIPVRFSQRSSHFLYCFSSHYYLFIELTTGQCGLPRGLDTAMSIFERHPTLSRNVLLYHRPATVFCSNIYPYDTFLSDCGHYYFLPNIRSINMATTLPPFFQQHSEIPTGKAPSYFCSL